MTEVELVLSIARSEVGYHEINGRSKFAAWCFGDAHSDWAWCCAFCCWVFNQANLAPIFYGGKKVGSCKELMRWAKTANRFVNPKDTPHPGDIVFYDFDHVGESHHVGIVEACTATTIWTIEGNTSDSVAYRNRSRTPSTEGGGVMGYFRPAYTGASVGPTSGPDWDGDAEESTNQWDVARHSLMDDIYQNLEKKGGVGRYIDTDNSIAYPKGTLFNAKYRSPKDLEADAIKELYQPGNYEFKLRRGSRNTMYPASFYGNPTIYFRSARDEKEYNQLFVGHYAISNSTGSRKVCGTLICGRSPNGRYSNVTNLGFWNGNSIVNPSYNREGNWESGKPGLIVSDDGFFSGFEALSGHYGISSGSIRIDPINYQESQTLLCEYDNIIGTYGNKFANDITLYIYDDMDLMNQDYDNNTREHALNYPGDSSGGGGSGSQTHGFDWLEYFRGHNTHQACVGWTKNGLTTIMPNSDIFKIDSYLWKRVRNYNGSGLNTPEQSELHITLDGSYEFDNQTTERINDYPAMIIKRVGGDNYNFHFDYISQSGTPNTKIISRIGNYSTAINMGSTSNPTQGWNYSEITKFGARPGLDSMFDRTLQYNCDSQYISFSTEQMTMMIDTTMPVYDSVATYQLDVQRGTYPSLALNAPREVTGMEIKIWDNFSKRPNSTKQPSNGQTYSVVLKEDCSVYEPVFVLTSSNLNWNYLSAWNRYYYITDIVSKRRNQIELHCKLDVLATYKANILSTSGLCKYSSTNYDVDFTDDKIACTNNISSVLHSTTAMPFSLDTTGCYLFACVNERDSGIGGSATYYALDEANCGGIKGYLCSSDFFDSMVKHFNNPLDVITDFAWIPIPYSYFSQTAEHVQIGDVAMSGAHSFGKRITTRNISTTVSITIPWVSGHTASFLDNPPYSQMYIYLPFVGTIPLENHWYGQNTIQCHVVLDIYTGDVVYSLKRGSTKIANYTGNIKTSLPIAGTTTGDFALIASSVSAGANIALNAMAPVPASPKNKAYNPAQKVSNMFSSAESSIGGIMQSQTHASIIGSNSSKAQVYLGTSIELYIFVRETKTTLADIRPYTGNICNKVISISGQSGYFQGNGISVSILGPEQYKNELNDYVNSGIFIE